MKVLGYVAAILLVLAGCALLVGFIIAVFQAPSSYTLPVVGALIALSSALGAKYLEAKNAVKKERRAQQELIYEQLTAKLIHASNDPDQLDQEALAEFFLDFTPKMLVHASGDFIKAWNNFRSAAVEAESNSNWTILATMADLLLAMRKDLGLSSTSLNRIDILAAFLNDLDAVDSQESQ